MGFERARQQILAELGQALGRVDPASVERLAQALITCRAIVVAGVGREGLTARGFAMRLMHLGFDAHWVWEDTCPPVGFGDTMLIVSGSGEIAHLDSVAQAAGNAGATLAVVTAVPSGTTARRADVVVQIPAQTYKGDGDLVRSVQPMGSLFEECTWLCFDSLVMMLADLRGLEHSDMADRHRNFE